MPQMTYPNQRIIKIHRERATANFLGIKSENWQAASRDLGAHALQLYLYLVANANNYTITNELFRPKKSPILYSGEVSFFICEYPNNSIDFYGCF